MIPASDLLIVVPTLNEERTLPDLLTWLKREHGDAQVIVADGGSTDRTLAVVEARSRSWPQLQLVDNPDRFQSAAVNRAADAFGQGRKWIIRIDAHAAYPEGYVRTLLEAALRHGAESVVVPMVTTGQHCFQIAAAAAQNSVLGTGGSPHRHIGEGRFVDHGHHALMRMDAFLAVGGYDTAFSHNEDAELDYRLRAAGYRIYLEPSAAIRYFPRSTMRALWRQYFNFGHGRARTFYKHRLRLSLRQLLPLLIAPMIAVGVAGMALRTRFPPASLLAAPLLAWIIICELSGVVLAVRDRSMCTLGSGSAMIVMHTAWSLGFWFYSWTAMRKHKTS